MTDLQQRPPDTGTNGPKRFTLDYPDLGTGPVDYEDSISQEFFEAEREAVFRRSWLKVGRIEQLRRTGSYFTRELPGLGSIIVSRSADGTVRAFHNVCAHRGNKVVWQEHPKEETKGSCREFMCKYHGWRYALDGKLSHVTNESDFYDLPKDDLGLPVVRCDVFAGFIFVNLAKDPEPLRTFLGDRLLELETYPFDRMTQRYGYRTRVKGNWKLSIDAVMEGYHPPYVHGRFIDPDVSKAEKMVPPVDAYYYDIFGLHSVWSNPGPPPLPPREPGTLGPPTHDQKWIYRLFRAGLFGPDDIPDVGPIPDGALNKHGIRSWGNDSFWLFPNFSVQIWARNYYITYQYWPESVDSHVYELDIYFPEPRNAEERLAQEFVATTTTEFAAQDTNTVEATHSMLATRANERFFLCDSEVLIRNFHKLVRDQVAAHQAGGAPQAGGEPR